MFILSHSVSLSLGGKTCVGLAEKVVFLIILVYPVNLLSSGCNLNCFLFTRNLLALELRQVQISRFLAVCIQHLLGVDFSLLPWVGQPSHLES